MQHLPLVLTAAVFVMVFARLPMVSRFDGNTARAILANAGPTQVVLGTLVNSLAGLLPVMAISTPWVVRLSRRRDLHRRDRGVAGHCGQDSEADPQPVGDRQRRGGQTHAGREEVVLDNPQLVGAAVLEPSGEIGDQRRREGAVKAHPDLGPGGRHGATVASGDADGGAIPTSRSRTWRCSAHPAHPGEGVGSALVRHVLHDRANASEPAYPETETEADVPLHERRGFGVVGDLDVPGGGPHLWLMWTRPPGALLTDARVATRRVSRRLSNPAARWVTPTTHSTERVVDWPAATAQDRSGRVGRVANLRQMRRYCAIPTARGPDVLAPMICAHVLARSAYSQSARDRRRSVSLLRRRTGSWGASRRCGTVGSPGAFGSGGG